MADQIPPGTIVAYGGDANNIPTGWQLCDGQSVLREGAGYDNLFAVIGTQFGYLDNTHFNVPDFRGVFLRGQNGTRNDAWSDPDRDQRVASGVNGATGNGVGSAQQDKLKDHQHSTGSDITASATFGRPAFQLGNNANQQLSSSGVLNSLGGNETRPKNVYVNYIIKK